MFPVIAIICLIFSLLVLLLRGSKRYYDCDICGRHAACEAWESAKASANHVCEQCRGLE